MSASPQVPSFAWTARSDRLLLSAATAILRWSPLRRGRMRVARRLVPMALRVAPTRTVRTTVGTRVFADLRTGMCTDLYFLGHYESALSRLVEAVVAPGDRCVDGGAAFGWYTVLCSRLVGPGGAVIAFEPNPTAYALLQRTVRLNEAGNIEMRLVALGRRSDRARIVMPPSSPTLGHATVRLAPPALAEEDPAPVEVVSVDTAVKGPVGFMKLDLEGSELAALEGAQAVLRDDQPWLLVEMAVATSQPFGHHPNDILALLVAHGYAFFAIDEPRNRLISFRRFPTGHPGANVLCVPPGRELPGVVADLVAEDAVVEEIRWA